MPGLAHDDMVVQRDAERLGDIGDFPRHANVGRRWRGVSRWMVVQQPANIEKHISNNGIIGYLEGVVPVSGVGTECQSVTIPAKSAPSRQGPETPEQYRFYASHRRRLSNLANDPN